MYFYVTVDIAMVTSLKNPFSTKCGARRNTTLFLFYDLQLSNMTVIELAGSSSCNQPRDLRSRINS
jgi:hypothetical protein